LTEGLLGQEIFSEQERKEGVHAEIDNKTLSLNCLCVSFQVRYKSPVRYDENADFHIYSIVVNEASVKKRLSMCLISKFLI